MREKEFSDRECIYALFPRIITASITSETHAMPTGSGDSGVGPGICQIKKHQMIIPVL